MAFDLSSWAQKLESRLDQAMGFVEETQNPSTGPVAEAVSHKGPAVEEKGGAESPPKAKDGVLEQPPANEETEATKEPYDHKKQDCGDEKAVIAPVHVEKKVDDDRVSRLRAMVDRLKNRLAEKEQLIQEKDRQIRAVVDDSDAQSKRHRRMKDMIQDLQAASKVDRQSLDVLKKRLDEKTRECSGLQDQLSAIQKGEKSNMSELQTLQSRLEALTEEDKEKKRKIDRLRGALEEAQNQLRDSETALKQQAERIDESSNETTLYFEGLIKQLQSEFDTSLKQKGEQLSTIAQENDSLKQKCRTLEQRGTVEAQDVSAATRPLLREIGKLKAQCELLTANYRAKRDALETEVKESNKVVHQLQERVLQTDTTTQEVQRELDTTLRRLSESEDVLEAAHSRIKELEKELQRAEKQIQDQKTLHQQQLDRLASEAEVDKEQLGQQVLHLQDKVQCLEKEVKEVRRREAVSLAEAQATDKPPHHSRSGSNWSDADSVSSPFGDTIVGSLASSEMVKRRDAQRRFFENQIKSMERARQELEDRVVFERTQKRELEAKLDACRRAKEEQQILQKQYDIALEVLGSKEEELIELKQEFDEVKQLFRSQTNQLLQTVEELRAKRTD